MTVTDDAGCSTAQTFTGQTVSCNGSAAASASHQVTVVAASCQGLVIGNDAGSQTAAPGQAGSWSFTVSAQNCTGGELHSMKLQGGIAGWLSSRRSPPVPALPGR